MRPLVEHVARALGAVSVGRAYVGGVGQGEAVWQECQQVSRSRLGLAAIVHGLGYVFAEEGHLAPHVVAQRPAYELVHGSLPLAPVGHVQHAGLEPGYHRGAERQVLVHAALRKARRVGVLLEQAACQPFGLGALYEALCAHKVLYVRAQLSVEVAAVRAVHGYGRSDFALGYGAEVDARHGAVGQHLGEVPPPLLYGGGGVPVEAYGYLLRHALRAYARLAVAVAGVEGEAHYLELLALAARAAQGVELVDFVQLGVEEVAVGLGRAHYEGRVGHVGVNLLYHQPLGALALVLVGSLRVYLVLPLAFAAQVLGVAQAYVGHDAVNGFRYAVLACAGARHEHVHQRGLVLHVVYVAEARAPQVGGQRREHGVGHGGPVRLGRAAHEQLDQPGQPLRHLGRRGGLRPLGARRALRQGYGLGHHARQGAALGRAGRVDEAAHLLLVQSVARHEAQHQFFPVVGDVSQVRGQAVQLVVALALLRFASGQLPPPRYYGGVGRALEAGLGLLLRVALRGRGRVGFVARLLPLVICNCKRGGLPLRRGLVGAFRLRGRWRRGARAEEPVLVDVQYVLARHEEGAPCHVLHAPVVGRLAQARRHPALRLSEAHAPGHGEHQAQPLGRGRHVGQRHAQFGLAPGHVVAVISARVADVVDVVHGEAAGQGLVVPPAPVGEGGVGRYHGQAALGLRLVLLEVVAAHLSAPGLLERVLDCGAYRAGLRRVHRRPEHVAGAGAHLA